MFQLQERQVVSLIEQASHSWRKTTILGKYIHIYIYVKGITKENKTQAFFFSCFLQKCYFLIKIFCAQTKILRYSCTLNDCPNTLSQGRRVVSNDWEKKKIDREPNSWRIHQAIGGGIYSIFFMQLLFHDLEVLHVHSHPFFLTQLEQAALWDLFAAHLEQSCCTQNAALKPSMALSGQRDALWELSSVCAQILSSCGATLGDFTSNNIPIVVSIVKTTS